MPENMNPRSTHLPEVAGAIEDVTATLVVPVGIREVQAFSVTLAQVPTAALACVAGILSDDKRTLTIKVMAADGVTPGATAAKVAWLALGK